MNKAFLFFLSFVFFSGSVFAATTFSVLTGRPTVDPSPFHFTRATKNIGQYKWNLGIQSAFGFGQLSAVGGANSVIGSMLVTDLVAALGFVDRLSLGFDMPFILLNQFRDPATAVTGNQTDVGDLRLEMKFTIVDPENHTLGVAFVPFVHVPTGNQDHFVGDQNVVGGFLFAADSKFLRRRLHLGANMGVQFQESLYFRSIQIGRGSVLFSTGVAYDWIPERWNTSVDLSIRTPTRQFFSEGIESPTEFTIQTQRRLGDSSLFFFGGAGYGLTHGGGNPLARAFMGLRFVAGDYTKTFGDKAESRFGPEPQEVPPIIERKSKTETIFFKPNSSIIGDENFAALKRSAEGLANHPNWKIFLKGYKGDALGMKRLQAVQFFFKTSGINPTHIQAIPSGAKEEGQIFLELRNYGMGIPKPTKPVKDSP